MLIQFNDGTSFGYSHPLKTLFKKGKLPTVEYGFYGDKLTKKNVTLEHILPRSKGGRSILENYALASREKNQARGNRDIKDYIDIETVRNYLKQFIGVHLPGFNGNKYVRQVKNTLRKLDVEV